MRLLADFGIVVLIWLVQLIIYPGFRHVIPSAFPRWHQDYMDTISWFVIPLMFTQLGFAFWVALRQPGLWNTLYLSAVLFAWFATFSWSVPCHATLQREGFQRETIDQLVRTNWLRTIPWSIAFLASCLALRRS